jgi:hypothetical protein
VQAAYAAWLARDAHRFPDLPVVFAILAGGGPFQLERLSSRGMEIQADLHSNLYFDTASYGRQALEVCLSAVGVTSSSTEATYQSSTRARRWMPFSASATASLGSCSARTPAGCSAE